MVKDIEIWMSISEYEWYEISNHGRVKYLKVGSRLKNRISNGQLTELGYRRVFLIKENKGKDKGMLVHVLVAKAFIPNPENKPQVNHKDGNKQNNHVSNLEWVTNAENQLHAFKIGLHKPSKGKDRYNARPISSFFDGIRIKSYSFMSEAISDGFNVVAIHHAIKRGGKHQELRWQYDDK